ncbi:hypothetical protein SAMN05661093_07590 [Kibdelosporangium aridum]|uniref:Uncharacterized protein n=1 Tax=Kibdelosporangium aridum TaxID=2030 RepID=A0A1W2FMA7_KIBAR|nr:hypothetical protein SAMN05661093_07590 [Kibdelosporangium aridum]
MSFKSVMAGVAVMATTAAMSIAPQAHGAQTAAGNGDVLPAVQVPQPDSRVDRGIRIFREYTGTGYKIWAEVADRHSAFYGHFHLWGPGLDVNAPAHGEAFWKFEQDTSEYHGSGNGWACAEGWRWTDRWESMGRPCIPV